MVGKLVGSADTEPLVLPIECSQLIEWWVADINADIEQLVLAIECSRLIAWWEAGGRC